MCPVSDSPKSISAFEPQSFVPPTELSGKAFDLASSLLAPAILNHSIRVYLYAKMLASIGHSIYHKDPIKHDLLFTACIMHDIGTTDVYNGLQRFEVEGADAAVKHLSQFGVSEGDTKEVWIAIAMHTCSGIVQRMGELPALLNQAISIDFGRHTEVERFPDLRKLKESVETRFAREDIEKVLCDAVVAQAVNNPDKAPAATWPGVLYRAHMADPSWKGVNKAFGE